MTLELQDKIEQNAVLTDEQVEEELERITQEPICATQGIENQQAGNCCTDISGLPFLGGGCS